VHFLFGKSPQPLHNIAIGDFFGLLKRQPLHHFRQNRGGGDGTGTAEGLKLGIGYPSVRTQLESKGKSIPASQRANLADTVRILNPPHILRMEEMLHHLFRIIPHCISPLPPIERCFAFGF